MRLTLGPSHPKRKNFLSGGLGTRLILGPSHPKSKNFLSGWGGGGGGGLGMRLILDCTKPAHCIIRGSSVRISFEYSAPNLLSLSCRCP